MASVTYKIGGKYDGKALKSAKKDFSDLAKIVKGFAVVKVAQELGKLANATKGVFIEQNKALTSFNTAVAKSNLNLTKLNNIKKQLSHGNFIDDDSLNNAMTFGIQMGLNAEQLDKVTRTAVNMASAGVKPLDKAMKDLTKTALSNTDELDKMVAQYDGFADAMSQTFSGRDTQFKNAFSDLKASIGAIPQSLQFFSEGKLLEPLNKVTEWFTSNRNQIINLFLHLPEVFGVVGKSLTNMFKKTFENFPSWISSVGVLFVEMFKDGFATIVNIGKEAFKGIATLLDFAIGNPFRSSKDFINVMLNNLIEGINGLASHLPKWAKKLLDSEGDGLIDFRFKTGTSDNNKTWDETAKAIERSMTNVSKAFKDGTKKTKEDWIKILDASTEFYKTDIDDMKKKLTDILGQDLPEELKKALEGMLIEGVTPSGKSYTDKQMATGKGLESIGTTALGGLGQIGSIVQSALQGGIWGVIANLLGNILQKIEEVSPLFSYFQNIFDELLNVLLDPDSGLIKAINDMIQPFLDGFNAVKEIFSSILNALGSIINAVTQVFNGLTSILNTIAPLLSAIFEIIGFVFDIVAVIGQMITPIVDAIMTIIAPIIEVIMTIIRAIYKFIATIVNVVIDIYNALKWWGDDIEHLNTDMRTTTPSKKYETYTPDLSGYTPASVSASSTSGSASYSAPKDVFVYITYQNSYINGDAREIALNIRDEIRNAERLGY